MNNDNRERNIVLQAGNAVRVQKNQMLRAEEQALQMHQALNDTIEQGKKQDDALEKLDAQIDLLERMMLDDSGDFEYDLDLYESYAATTVQANIVMGETVPLSDELSWEEYLSSVELYARLECMDLSSDPYLGLLSKSEQESFVKQVREDFYERKPHCDALDCALAALAGTIGGLVDILGVGSPENNMTNSVIGRWTDQKTDSFIEKITGMVWDHDAPTRDKIKALREAKEITLDGRNRMLKDAGIPYSQNLNTRPSGLQQCIQYLEKKFGVNYDASSAAWLDPNDLAKLPIEKQEALGSMRPQNHHLLSLAHSPDLIGLLFSILDQFTGKTSIIASGEFIRVMPKEKKNEIDQFELRGSNVISKIFCGFINWLGHCLSDLVGSNTTRADPAKRGTGLPIPGFELFQFISLAPGPQEKIAQDLADLSVKVFESGYDARFGIALSIPVITSDLLTRLTFSLKRYFYHHLPINECIPMDTKVGSITHQPELRRMLLIAHGTLCAWDVGDAVIQGVVQGNVLSAALRLNYWGYIRLSQDALAALRARCRQNHIDIDAITKCTQEEWKVLYTDAQKWVPVGLNE